MQERREGEKMGKKRKTISTTSDSGSLRGASCWRPRENYQETSLRICYSASWASPVVAAFCPLGPPQTTRATGVRMATAPVGEHVMGSRALPASQERTRQGGRRMVGEGR